MQPKKITLDIAITTDSYVVDPIFFPGGNIGSLAVHGTVNDLCMQGATPWVESVAQSAHEAGVKIVAGDTKVVPDLIIDSAPSKIKY